MEPARFGGGGVECGVRWKTVQFGNACLRSVHASVRDRGAVKYQRLELGQSCKVWQPRIRNLCFAKVENC